MEALRLLAIFLAITSGESIHHYPCRYLLTMSSTKLIAFLISLLITQHCHSQKAAVKEILCPLTYFRLGEMLHFNSQRLDVKLEPYSLYPN